MRLEAASSGLPWRQAPVPARPQPGGSSPAADEPGQGDPESAFRKGRKAHVLHGWRRLTLPLLTQILGELHAAGGRQRLYLPRHEALRRYHDAEACDAAPPNPPRVSRYI